MASTKVCESISLQCSVEVTTYGYHPSLAGNIVMVAIFAICAITQVFLGIKYRLRAYPIDSSCKSCCSLSRPSLLAAGLYLTLKHLVIHYGPDFSRLSPKFYTWLFVVCDAIGFLAQCIRGSIQASANNTNKKTLNLRNNIIVAGISFQAVTMLVCGVLSLDFAYNLYRHREEKKQKLQAASPKGSKGFQFYMACFVIAFIAILIRCIYRILEMAGGWKNPLMRNEVEFMILDGAYVESAFPRSTFTLPTLTVVIA
ncbi:RTA1 like protein-domain-containing protein [Leptodontidium sp. 2 PMI_412]|nr:RTA1 like protein-domain-containing protein [Leptodontidium sp. 2 PMI_412]